jgi:2,3-bisphosphoglycerate-independent phosphoglycerate mutase
VVEVLVILDGASEPLRDGEPTSLELARTPALDRLARQGELTRLRTIAPGLPAGSESAIPALLGWTPGAPVDRGALEAAAYGIEVGDGRRAWRVDVVPADPRSEFVPAGATGMPASDLAAKAAAARGAIEGGAACVVVHVGGPDEAAHRGDRAAKVASIERADREVIGPLTADVLRAGGTLTVYPDHGCDPATGEHDAAAVPSVTWSPAALRRELARVPARRSPRRLTERAVGDLRERTLPRRAVAGAAA